MTSKAQRYNFYVIVINIIFFYSLAICSEKVLLWDLGVVIHPKHTSEISNNSEQEKNIQKYALLANRHVSPKSKIINLNQTVFPKDNFENLDFISQLKISNDYFLSDRFVQTLILLEKIDQNELSINQKRNLQKKYVDSLFNLGDYNKVVDTLRGLDSLDEELLFLLGFSLIKTGNKKDAIKVYNKILIEYPEGDYKNLAKLQVRALSR